EIKEFFANQPPQVKRDLIDAAPPDIKHLVADAINKNQTPAIAETTQSPKLDPSAADAWYYVERDKAVGPVTLPDLKKLLSLVSDSKDVLVWRPGFANWERAESVPDLASVLPPKPPPIPRSQRAQVLPADPFERLKSHALSAVVILAIIMLLSFWSG